MTGLRRVTALSFWTAFGLVLIWALFWSLDLSFMDALTEVLTTPLWCFAAVVVLTFLNKIVGMLKWRVAAQYIAEPGEMPSALRMIELTALGAFLGQVLPLQVATVLSRWVLLDSSGRKSGLAVRATIFEQVFDLIVLIAGAIAGLLVLLLKMPASGALGTLVGVVALALIFLRSVIRLGALTLRWLSGLGPFSGTFREAALGFEKAASAGRKTMLTLCGYSLVRLVLVGLRSVVILFVFAPMTSSWFVFVASPGIGLLTALPVTPAGLGVAEWSWSAVLVLGDSTAAVAAIAAVNVRLVGMLAQLVVVLAVSTTRILVDRMSKPGKSLP